MAKETLFALDLGTTKFCLACLDLKRNLEPIRTISLPAQGMRRGMLADFNDAKEALLRLLEIAENEFQTDITPVHVGISGCHLTSRGVLTKKSFEKTTSIDYACLKSIQENAKKIHVKADKEILHAIPITYQPDNRLWLDNPIGLSCQFLSAKHLLIEADKNYLQDILKLCNQCGIEIKGFTAEPYASAEVTLTQQLKDIGVAVCDIGGGTTDGIVFFQGKPLKVFTINIGGKLMSNDLSVGLGINFQEAEKLKIIHGLKMDPSFQTIQSMNIYNQNIEIHSKKMFSILAPRIYELGVLIKRELSSLPLLGGGVILTGGGSEVEGMAPFLSQKLGLSFTKISPQLSISSMSKDDIPLPSLELATKYATISGLLKIAHQESTASKFSEKDTKFSGYFLSFWQWLKELS